MVSPRTTPPRAGDWASARPAFDAGPGGVVVAAPAKLNLFLELLGKRPDGYHELATLMVAVDLYDTLEVRAVGLGEPTPPQPLPEAERGFAPPSLFGKGAGGLGSSGPITLTCDPPGLPTGPENLVYKAADALRRHANRPDLGASIRLTKRIPAQAGLAGGSSDAAAALLALNRVWQLDLPHAELAAVAAEVGSDVAFFLDLPAAWCTGRGEIVSPESAAGPFHFVLVCPPVGLSTADVYRKAQVPSVPVSGDGVRAAFRAGDAAALGPRLFNRLQGAAFGLAPAVESGYRRLAGLNPAGCLMSGSGSAFFALCRSRPEAARVAAAFRAAAVPGEPESRVLVVRSIHIVPA